MSRNAGTQESAVPTDRARLPLAALSGVRTAITVGKRQTIALPFIIQVSARLSTELFHNKKNFSINIQAISLMRLPHAPHSAALVAAPMPHIDCITIK